MHSDDTVYNSAACMEEKNQHCPLNASCSHTSGQLGYNLHQSDEPRELEETEHDPVSLGHTEQVRFTQEKPHIC